MSHCLQQKALLSRLIVSAFFSAAIWLSALTAIRAEPAGVSQPRVLASSLPGGLLRGMAVTPDGAFLLARFDGSVSLIDTVSGRVIQSIPVTGNGAGVCTDKEGDDIFVGSGTASHPSLLWLTLEQHTLAFKAELPVPNGTAPEREVIAGLAYGPNKAIYTVDMSNGRLLKLMGKRKSVIKTMEIGGHPESCALEPGADILAVSDETLNTVRLFNPDTLLGIGRIPVERPGALAWSHSGLLVADGTGVIHSIAGKHLSTVSVNLSKMVTAKTLLAALAVSPDGRLLFIGENSASGKSDILVMKVP